MRIRFSLLLVAMMAVMPTALLHAASQPVEPGVEITSPPKGATISGSQVEITVSFVSDEEQPVSRIQIFLDGKAVTERLYKTPVARGVCTFRWDTLRTPNGKHKVDAQAFSGDDYLGMASCSVTVSNIKTAGPDLAAPKVAITSPKEGETVSGVVPVIIEASDDSGKPPFVTVYVDKKLRSVKNHGPYSFDWDTTQHSNGPVYLEATAADSAGNTGRSKGVRVVIRNTTKQPPITMRPLSGEVTMPESTPSIAVPANTASRANEHPRTLATPNDVQTERFEVERPSVSSVRTHPLPTESAAKTSDAQIPEGTPSDPAAAPVLMAKLVETDVHAPVMKTDRRLVTPKVLIASMQVEADLRTPESLRGLREYVVQPGDSIIRLAKKFGVTPEAIIALNSIEDPALIRIGDRLRIPAPRKMVSLRPIFERAGGTVVWDQEAQVVRAVCVENDVTLKPGSAQAIVNDQKVLMDGPAVVRNGRTLVPETFVTEALDMAATGQ